MGAKALRKAFLCAKPAAHPHIEGNLAIRSGDGNQADIVNLVSRAVLRATGNRYLEFPWQVGEFMITEEIVRNRFDQGFSVYKFGAVNPGRWASRDVSGNVAARTG